MMHSAGPDLLETIDIGGIGVAVGAFVGAALSVLVSELIKFRVSRQSRRDERRLDQLTAAALDVARNARAMLHAVGSKGSEADPKLLSEAHEAVRVGVDHLQMVSGAGVQTAALLVRHHVYAVRKVGDGQADPHADYGVSVYLRTEHSIEHLLESVRRQLGVTGRVVDSPNYGQLTMDVQKARAPRSKMGGGTPMPTQGLSEPAASGSMDAS